MNEYIPKSLRPSPGPKPREVMFGIGIEKNTNEFGMTHGPFPTSDNLLEVVPEDNSCIIRFNADHTETVIWRWKKDRWIREN